MQRVCLSMMVCCLILVGASVASAQQSFYCVKPGGAPIASIVMPNGDHHDPSVVCNAMVAQCFLTCTAVVQVHDGQAVLPPNLPSITVTPQMLAKLDGAPVFESREYCDNQYRACVAHCQGDRACLAYCQSVRSGCGTGNKGAD